MALSDILKKYGEEEGTQISQGIMFPFQKGVDSTSTTQQVYNSATDGIMTMEGKPYTGPTATIQYGTAEQGYPRMLREIEQGELPQFRQEDFPKVGEGITEIPTPVTPPTTQPVEEEQPTIDPCPPGFALDPVKGICVPIEQPRSDKQEPLVDTRTNNEKAADILEDYGVKLTGEGGIFADPEKTKSVFEFGELPTFTQKDFEGGLPFYVPFSGIINEIIKYSNISQLKNLGVIEEISKGNYKLTQNGIRGVVQSSIDRDRPRMERELRKQGFTQSQIDSGQALAEMRKDDYDPGDYKIERNKDFEDEFKKKHGMTMNEKIKENKRKADEARDSGGGKTSADYAREAKEAREAREFKEKAGASVKGERLRGGI